MSGTTDSAIGAARTFRNGAGPKSPAARLGVAVVEEIVASIVTGEIAPGESLPPEAILSQHFGVSRTVIRESVKRIEEKGLIRVAQGRGTEVMPAGSWNVLDPVVLSALLENDDSVGVLDELAIVRGALEGSMSAATAAGRTEEQLTLLRAALAHMRETISDDEAFGIADADFHFLVMAASGNRLAENITNILFQRARDTTRFRGAPIDHAFELTLEEHARVLDAIDRQDAAGAEAAMRAHISDAWQRRRLPTHRRNA